jgi:uncharacterized damage-inducible protein DinB
MKRPEANEFLPYYAQYINKVGDGDIVAVLSRQIGDTTALIAKIPETKRGHRYADGKWSIAEVIGHIIDTERIMSGRALRFARNDKQPLPGFEQNDYIAAARFNDIPLAELSAELEAVRRSTCAFLKHVNDEESKRTGTANGAEVSVRALAYIMAGHELHHRGVLEERYLKS